MNYLLAFLSLIILINEILSYQFINNNKLVINKNNKYSSLSVPSSRSSIQRKYVIRTNYKTFDEFLETMELPVLVDFYAEWCGPCKMMVPVLEELANRLENVTKIAKVDTDKSPRLGNRYQVEALPTLILFHKGQVIERYLGYRTVDELEIEIKNALKKIQT